jgi:hypothetical protein
MLSSAHTPLPDFFARCRQRIAIFYDKNSFCHVSGREAGLEGALVYYKRMTNSIRPLYRHTPSSPILVPNRARKLSPQINVELVVGLEVFSRLVHTASGHGVFCPTPLMPSMT